MMCWFIIYMQGYMNKNISFYAAPIDEYLCVIMYQQSGPSAQSGNIVIAWWGNVKFKTIPQCFMIIKGWQLHAFSP